MNLNRRVGEATTRLGDATSAYHEQGFGSRIGFGERPALVVVDMQRDFVDPDAPTTCAPMAQERLPAIRSLLEMARAATIPVFFTQGLVRPDLSDLGLWKGPHGQGRVQIEGTPGAEIVPELARLPSETIIPKRRPSAFHRTPLDSFLREAGVDTLILAGSSMSGCVRATAVDAFSRDYRTIIVRDCVIDRSLDLVESNLRDVEAKYGDAVSLDETITYLRSLPQAVPAAPRQAASDRSEVRDLSPEDVWRAARALRDEFDGLVPAPIDPSAHQPAADDFASFLASHLPPARTRVTRGTVFDSGGHAVQTAAVLVTDASGSPPLPLDDGNELIPAEALFAAVRVVPRLERADLPGLLRELAAVKSLHREPVIRGEERVNDCGAAIVAYEGLAGDALLEALASENSSIPFEHQVDAVAVLDHGVATFAELDPDGTVTLELPLRPSPRHRLCWIETGPTTLFLFYLLLWEALRGRSLRSPSMHTLLRHMPSTTARTLPSPHGIDRGE